MQLEAGINFYAYVNNNPVNANDPSGMASLMQFIDNGIRVLNKAIETHPVTGVKFADGFPDFSQYAIKQVELNNLTGTSKDFSLANKAAGLDKTPAGYTWHHVEDGTTMQLIPSDIHSATGHTGGSAWLKAGVVAAGVTAAGDAEAAGVTWSDVKGFAKGVGDFAKDILTDPSTYFQELIFLTPTSTGGCNSGVCGDMMNYSNHGATGSFGDFSGVTGGWGSSAAGGYLLYPNKPNNNQMQSVYSK